MRPDGVSNSDFHFLIGYVISIRDTEEFAETSHLQCLYPSFNVYCYGPYVSHANKNNYGHGQGTHLILELMEMFLSFQMTFSCCFFFTATVVWAIPESTSGLDPSCDTIVPRYKAMDGLQFLVVYGNVNADAIGVICHQLGLLCTDLHVMCCGGLFKVIYQLNQLLILSS